MAAARLSGLAFAIMLAHYKFGSVVFSGIAMAWLIENWAKSTIFLAIYTTVLLALFVLPTDMSLFLIWLQTPVYFLHQFEEYIFPGGFMAVFNTKVLGSERGDFPLRPTEAFWINVPIIFAAFPLTAVLASLYGVAIGLWPVYFSIINAASHVGMSFKMGYNPGLVASVALNIPVGLFTVGYLVLGDAVSWQAHGLGLLIGLGVQGGVMVYGFAVLKRRIPKPAA